MKTAILFLLLLVGSKTANFTSESDLLQRGLSLEEQGAYEQALEVWSGAYGEAEAPSLAIGREYIRLATEQNLQDYYESASSIYLWGLTAERLEPNRDALERELAMLKTLVNPRTHRRWVSLVEADDPVIYRELRAFWQQLNPTPSTRYNERLIEHWERIAYAREHYNRRNDPPYGTDDRGPAYIKYGKPDRTQTGNLVLHPGEVYSECNGFPGCNPEKMREIIMEIDPNPYYEIWIYDEPNTRMEYNLIMIFGDAALRGFRRVETIEDFIPAGAFSLNDRYAMITFSGKISPGSLFTPGMIMQFLYYKQLATTDFFFANRFNELQFEWDVGESPAGIARLGKYQGPLQEERSKMTTLLNFNKAPPEISTYEKEFPAIPLQAFHYRLLDEQNRPVAATFLESRPRQVFLEDLAFNEDALYSDDTTTAEEAFAHYELTHGLLVTGPDGQVATRLSMPAELILDFQENMPSSTVFTVPYSQSEQRVTLYAELHNRHPDSAPRVETPFKSALRGIGRIEELLPEPLSTDPGQLEMADLVLGWQMRHDVPVGTLFPFVVANHREIPEGEELAVHLEIYNLERGVDGFAEFTIEYDVHPVRQMEWLRGQAQQDVSLTLDQQTRETRYVENLEILTRELAPGLYRLQMSTTDNVSGQQTHREIEFQVVERADREPLTSNRR